MVMKFIDKAVGKRGNVLHSFQELKLRIILLNSFAGERFSYVWSN